MAKKKTTDALDTADARAPGVYVLAGNAITTRAGTRVEGDRIYAKNVGGGEETLTRLIASGVCERVG